MGRKYEEIWLVRTTSLNCGGNSGRDVCKGERGSFHKYNDDMLLLKAQQIPYKKLWTSWGASEGQNKDVFLT
jgi:hypothetical protein